MNKERIGSANCALCNYKFTIVILDNEIRCSGCKCPGHGEYRIVYKDGG